MCSNLFFLWKEAWHSVLKAPRFFVIPWISGGSVADKTIHFLSAGWLFPRGWRDPTSVRTVLSGTICGQGWSWMLDAGWVSSTASWEFHVLNGGFSGTIPCNEGFPIVISTVSTCIHKPICVSFRMSKIGNVKVGPSDGSVQLQELLVVNLPRILFFSRLEPPIFRKVAILVRQIISDSPIV